MQWFRNNKTEPESKDVESGGGEATPLLADKTTPQPLLLADKTTPQPLHTTDDGSAPMGYHGAAGAAAPPPAAPPPPPPLSPKVDEAPDEENNKEEKTVIDSYQKRTESSTSLSNRDDNASQSQLSRKSGKSQKSRKKKSASDAASVKSEKSKKAKKKKREGPQKSICHLLFDAVRLLAIVASCMMFTMQFIPLVILGNESTWLQIAVRSYVAIFCFSFILAESRIPFLQRVLSLHDNWILRGFLYSFIGLVGMEQDLAVKVEDIASGTGASSILGPDYGTLFASLYMSITTWLMIGVGLLYTILGLLCMQRWYERLEKGHREKIKEWKRKKEGEEEYKKSQEDERHESDRRRTPPWYDDLEDDKK